MIDTLLQILREAFAHNQFLQGGFVLAIVGGAVAYFRRLPAQGLGWLRSRFIITLDVSNDDPVFFWIAGWLAAQPYSKRARSLTVTSRRDHYGNAVTSSAPTPSRSADEPHLPDIIFTPAPGLHIFRYRKTVVWLSRNREQASPDKTGGFMSLFNRESFQLRIFGRGQGVARSLVEEARRMAVQERPFKTEVYVLSYDSWRQVDARDPRPLSTVFLPDGCAESLRDDVKAFMECRNWYVRRGIPYRRGYLFHGIPGSGKTSLICALAGELRLNLYILNLSSSAMSDSQLQYGLSNVPPGSIVLLEDIDAAFAERKKDEDVKNSLTFSGLLNALDGAASREGWLVFMTTNRKDVLDPALIRPGRADVHIEFDFATRGQAARMFLAWFPEAGDVLADKFGAAVASRRMSMAEVQAHLLLNKDSAAAAWVLPEAAPMPVIQVEVGPGAATA